MDSSTQNQTQPLTTRSTNTHLSQSSTATMQSTDAKKFIDMDSKPTTDALKVSMEHHRKALQEKLQNGGGADDQSNRANYVSPSDDIMSPCTKKLSDLKGKRFKAGKPTSLFAKLGKKNYEQSSASASPSHGAPAPEAE
ncbi:conserved hypothetical protein [Talaromyces stipitatus ATCC 10500]|uniref:Spo12 family protein n=1 Tax=Talaromyces stipitatus (strain ATCC 10500 / CBS 375.48 / QM 6759 / NRRL 1006) TaxID=441959 RepID=B8MBQ3_TALSN|nr:uncharacterized protein TSTA_119480 [Talaromyces stipitatus ATCC 10500]EED18186.1 conserved hypothetical protein [Talaromyces stipitatus ATCC 10500]